MEARLRAAWCQVLDMEENELDGDSHFFQQGGDSVAAVRLVAAAQAYKIQIDNATIYDFPLLKDMASNSLEIHVTSYIGAPDAKMQHLEEGLVEVCATTCRVEQQAIEDIFPADEIQRKHLSWHFKNGGFLLQYVFQIHGPAQSDLIREAVELIRQKNQILRTRLVQHNGALYQVVIKDTAEWYQGSSLSEYKSDVFSPEGRVGYGDPLFRYAFIQEDRNLYFVYTGQHCGFDGWSNRLLFDALEDGLRNIEALRQKTVQTQFKQFGAWCQSRAAAKDEVFKSISFWRTYLDGFQSFAKNRFNVPPDYMPCQTMQLTKVMPLGRRASPFALSTMAHAAWAISLGNIYQQDDTLFVSITSGRQFPRESPLPGVESIMGPLSSSIYLRTRLRADQAIGELLRDTQDNIVSNIPHQREKNMAGPQVLGPQAVYLSYFNWHPIGTDTAARVFDFENFDGSTTRLEGRRDLHTPFTSATRVIIDVWEHQDHLRIIAKWDDKLYDDDLVALMLDHFTKSLSRIAASTAQRVGDLWTIPLDGELANGHKLPPHA